MIRSLSVAVSAIALLVALGEVALASECHKNCNGGYLAMTALVAGSLALGSAALGTRLGGSGALKRVERADMEVAGDAKSASMSRVDEAATSTDVPPEPPILDSHDRAAAATRAEVEPASATVDHSANVVKHGSEFAGKVAKEMAPHGGTIDSGLGVAQKVIANEDRVAGLAEGLTDAAVEEVKDVVRDASKVATPAPSVGASVRYCPSCGTKTREGARFCGSCGTRLG